MADRTEKRMRVEVCRQRLRKAGHREHSSFLRIRLLRNRPAARHAIADPAEERPGGGCTRSRRSQPRGRYFVRLVPPGPAGRPGRGCLRTYRYRSRKYEGRHQFRTGGRRADLRHSGAGHCRCVRCPGRNADRAQHNRLHNIRQVHRPSHRSRRGLHLHLPPRKRHPPIADCPNFAFGDSTAARAAALQGPAPPARRTSSTDNPHIRNHSLTMTFTQKGTFPYVDVGDFCPWNAWKGDCGAVASLWHRRGPPAMTRGCPSNPCHARTGSSVRGHPPCRSSDSATDRQPGSPWLPCVIRWAGARPELSGHHGEQLPLVCDAFEGVRSLVGEADLRSDNQLLDGRSDEHFTWLGQGGDPCADMYRDAGGLDSQNYSARSCCRSMAT